MVRPSRIRPSPLAAWPLLALLGASPLVAAQVQLPPAQTAVVEIHAAQPAGPDVPQPPRAVGFQGPAHTFTTVPQGLGGTPQPDSPPSMPAGAGGPGPLAPCDLRFFMNNPVAPVGASISNSTGEPNVAVQGDGVLYAGNWFAARSSDSGMSWARYNPYSFFPASDGGFCCDQRTLFVRNPDMTIWLLEYGYSASTQQGRLRIAFTRNSTDLKNDNFYYFDLTPGTFGQPAGRFLDFSDISYSNGFLYGSAIIATPPAASQGLLLWRANLFDIWDLGGVGLGYYTSAQLGGIGSYRFAQGSSDPMYWAAHTSTTNLRVWSWADGAGAASQFDRTVAAWSTTPTAAAGPDGRDWTGFGYTVNAVLSGYARFGEVGFLWSSGAVPPGRPQTFVRVARLRTGDLALIGQDDIWNGSFAWHFPTCATNAAGEVGGTIAYGGGGASGFYPSTAVFLVDQCSPNWAPLANATFAAGARGPSANRWGDYLGAARHSVVTNTFVGAGFALDSTGSSTPRFVWFGRERDEPGWVDAGFTATDVAGAVPVVASLTVAQTDRFGRKDGTTSFSRSYPPRQALIVTAPRRALSTGGVPHYFSHWIYQGNAQSAGVTTLSVGDLGTGPRTVAAQARYLRVSTVTVDAQPVSAVPITVSNTDLNGQGNGTTLFQREYLPGGVVSLTAPAQSGSSAFRYWVVNGVPGQPNQLVTSFTTDADVTAVADYGTVIGNGTQWRDITAASPAPPARYDHAMAFHAPSGRIVMFGGTPYNAETWELSGDQWAQAAPTNVPAARARHAMTFDPTSQTVLMFGGQDPNLTPFDETWSWDGTDWTQLQPVTSPSPRHYPAMAYDPVNGTILLFGGVIPGGAFGQWVNETWSFDGVTWTQLAPVTAPNLFQNPMMVTDPARGRVVLQSFDGTNTAETWEWDGTDWIAMAPATLPPGRMGMAFAHDTLRGRTVLFAGRTFPQFRDTWEWNGTDWVQRFTATAPAQRSWHAMAYDPAHSRCVLFGGFTDPFTTQADTWVNHFACEIIGQGHPGGGLSITCTSPPQIGQNFCVEFPSDQQAGFLVLGLGAPLNPPIPLGPPEICNPGSLYAFPDLLLDAPGNPGTACIAIPNDPVLIGALVTVQGMALDAAFCFNLTDAMAVLLQP